MSTFFITIPHLAFILCNKNILRFCGLVSRFWYLLVVVEICKMDTQVRVSLSYNAVLFTFEVQNKYDIAVLKEVFIFKEYQWESITKPKIILDLGAHIGDTALYYHAVYPEAVIYAVEPNPVLFARLRKNVAGITQIIPVHCAISDTTGSASLNVSSRSSLRGSLEERSGSDTSVEVPTLTLQDLYTIHGISRADLIKFDIEGAEKSMFGNKQAIEYADAYIGELHCDLAHIEPEVFLQFFVGMSVDIQPMRRSNRFSIKAHTPSKL